MRLWLRISLLAFVLSLCALCAAAGWMLYDTERQAVERETQRALDEHQMMMDSMKSSMESFALGMSDQTALENAVSRAIRVAARFSTHPGVRLRVADETGALLYTSLPDGLDTTRLPQAADVGSRNYVLLSGEQPIIAVTGQFVFLNRPYTLLYIRDVSQLFADARALALRTTWIVCTAIVLLAVLLILTIRRTLRPLHRLARIAREMAAGDYTKRAVEKGGDEVSALAADFNSMADAVEQKIGALTHTADAQTAFIANLAHEMKTPMTSIVGYADLMQRVELPPEKQEQALGHISREGKRLERLSFKLLELFSLTQDQSSERKEEPVVALLRAAANAVNAQAEAKNLTIAIDCAVETLVCDEVLITSLLINLLDNACKASQPGDTVRLLATREGNAIVLAVQDRGMGIPSAELSRVTEPFYMVDKARSRSAHGAGLGLPLAKAIAEAHGARLCIQSEEGEGTKVSIEFEDLQLGDNSIAKPR